MATGPKVLDADWGSSEPTSTVFNFDTAEDEMYLISEIRRLRRTTDNANMSLEIQKLYDPSGLHVDPSGDQFAYVASNSAMDDLLGASPLLDVRVAAQPFDETTWGDTFYMVGDWVFGDGGWYFYLSGGNLTFRAEPSVNVSSNAGVSNPTGQDFRCVRVTVQETATPELELRFYEKSTTEGDASADLKDHSGWTQVGTVVTDADHSIDTTTHNFHFGARAYDDSARGYHSQAGCVIYDDVGAGNIVLDAMHSSAAEGSTSYTEGSSNGFTVTADSGVVFGLRGEAWHERVLDMGNTWSDGDVDVESSDDPLLVVPPKGRISVYNQNTVDSSNWWMIQFLGVSIDPGDHKVIWERVIADDVVSTFTCPSGASWVFSSLHGHCAASATGLDQVTYSLQKPGESDAIQSYTVDDFDGPDSKGYAHLNWALMLRDGMSLEVDYTSNHDANDLWTWFLVGKEVL